MAISCVKWLPAEKGLVRQADKKESARQRPNNEIRPTGGLIKKDIGEGNNMKPFVRFATVLLLGVVANLQAIAAMAANVDSVRLWRAPDHTRLVFDLSGPLQHKLFTLENPTRVVIDLERAQFSGNLASLDLAD